MRSDFSLRSSKCHELYCIQTRALIRHDNVVQYKESFIDIGTQTVCLVMEYCEEGDMLQKIE